MEIKREIYECHHVTGTKKHYPVMLDQVLSIISPQHGGTFIDCTFGGGGYSKAILEYPDTKVLAIDRDKLTSKHADILIKNWRSPGLVCHDQ